MSSSSGVCTTSTRRGGFVTERTGRPFEAAQIARLLAEDK
jgi:hypothetical protein